MTTALSNLFDHPLGQRTLTCFYHGGCPDGIGGAYAVFAALEPQLAAALRARWDADEPEAEDGPHFTPIQPGKDHALDGVAGRDVVYVDVVPSKATLAAVAAAARSVTVLDHHPNAKRFVEALSIPASTDLLVQAGQTPALERLAETLSEHAKQAHPQTTGSGITLIYAEDRSGAQLAWDWAHPGVARPPVIDYIGDRDLWRFALPDSRAINEALFIEGHTRSIQALASFVAGAPDLCLPRLADRGAQYCRVKDQTVARLTKRAHPAVVRVHAVCPKTQKNDTAPPGEADSESDYSTDSESSSPPCAPNRCYCRSPLEYNVLVVNSPILGSELGEAMMATAPADIHFAVAWSYDFKSDEIWASARTNRPDVDLSSVIPRLVGTMPGGGGHPRAAGFSIKGDSIRPTIRRPPRWDPSQYSPSGRKIWEPLRLVLPPVDLWAARHSS